MYFNKPRDWYRTTRQIFRSTAAHAWAGRRDAVWWRGSMGDMWPGGRPRAHTVGAYHDRPWADFAFTEAADRWELVYANWVRNQSWGPRLPPGLAAVRHGRNYAMSMAEVATYRYALHLPGFFQATYSRTLQFLLWSGTTIFVYDCPYYEFYYHRLRPFQHYIPANGSNLPARVGWARGAPEAAARIAQHASRFARRFLSAAAVADYWRELLRVYGRLQRFAPLEVSDLSRLCTCWRGSVRPPDWVLVGVQHCGRICARNQIKRDSSFRKPLFTIGGAAADAEAEQQPGAEQQPSDEGDKDEEDDEEDEDEDDEEDEEEEEEEDVDEEEEKEEELGGK